MSEKVKKTRFVTLDMLRGYFVLVIIIDHFNRFPSLFAWVTGQGRLWVSAGEGFFIISGLLVGYTRGYKKLAVPMKVVTKLLYKRAIVLYVCSVVASSLLLILTIHSQFPAALQPSVIEPRGSFLTAIYQILTLRFVFEWVYFLKFYVASMLLAPIFIWLMRKKQTGVSVALAFVLWLIGYHIEQDWLQWQILFFVPAALGFHLETVRSFWRKLSNSLRKSTEVALASFTIFAIALSSFWVFGWELVKEPRAIMSFERYIEIRQTIDPLFYKVQLSMGRVLLALACFAGLYVIFNFAHKYVGKYTDWLFLSFGKYSLLIYVIHGFIILPMQVFIPIMNSSLINTLLGISILVLVFAVSRNAIVRRVVPR